jgi:membrane protease YdiL (CAAX protease family)
MKPVLSKFLAVVEVIFVAFALVPFLTLGLYRLFPGVQTWQVRVGFNVPILFYVVSMAVPFLLALLRWKRPAAYGIDFRNPKYHLDIMLTCFLPVVLVSGLYSLAPANSWGNVPILIAGNIVLLLALAWFLRKKPAAGSSGILVAGLAWVPGLSSVTGSFVGKAVVLFLNYAIFVGFGEEILYRGYIESSLNEVFGRPFKFSGVSFGWSILITNLLFGLMHVGVVRWILGINYGVTLAWGCWTIFSGLVFSFVREKTGSILAPALLHGLPQVIAWVAMLFLK